jgi:cell division protein ZapA
MTVKASEAVSIRLLDREYTVGCAPDERDALLASARLLDAKMREIRGSNRMVGLDRVAVLAALNLAHELLQLRADSESKDRELARSLGELQRKLDGLFEPRTPG